MPRPTSKKDLLQQAQAEHQTLEQMIQNLDQHQLTTQLVTSRWTAKDVLAHLSEWEQMALGWQQTAQRGQQPALPAEGYNWRQLPELNQAIYLKYKDASLKSVLERFQQSYQEILALIQSLSDNELFEPGHFAWTKQNNLATYLISATSSHYNWANTRIKRAFRPIPAVKTDKAKTAQSRRSL